MTHCSYCGEANPATVFNCLKCAALMPVTPAPVQNVEVFQQRPLKPKVENPVAVIAPVEKNPSTGLSWKDLGIYFSACVGMIAFVCLIFLMFYLMSKNEPSRSAGTIKPRSTVSASATASIKAPRGILVATSEESFAEMMRAAVAGDDAYLTRMGAEGKVFRLQDGTKIRIIDGGMVKSKVSAIDGNQAGRVGWLPNEFIAQ